MHHANAGGDGVARDDKATAWPSAELAFVGAETPVMILISVDLPAPFSPSRAWMEPRERDRDVLERLHAREGS